MFKQLKIKGFHKLITENFILAYLRI